MEKKTANLKAVCLSITYANVTVEKKFIVGGDELSKHPYSCGCTPKPKRSETGRPNDWALGYDKDQHAMTCMLKHTRAVYATCKSGVSGVTYNKKRKRWEVLASRSLSRIIQKKQGAIEARIEGEKKYFAPYINKEKNRKE